MEDTMARRTNEELIHNASLYRTRTEMAQKDGAAYRAIIRRGIQDDAFAHMPVPKRYTRAELEAAAAKYSTRTEWMYGDPATFQAAHRMGIAGEIGPESLR
jgi:hypothetical protein